VFRGVLGRELANLIVNAWITCGRAKQNRQVHRDVGICSSGEFTPLRLCKTAIAEPVIGSESLVGGSLPRVHVRSSSAGGFSL